MYCFLEIETGRVSWERDDLRKKVCNMKARMNGTKENIIFKTFMFGSTSDSQFVVMKL